MTIRKAIGNFLDHYEDRIEAHAATDASGFA
jgi:hypothetical protein